MDGCNSVNTHIQELEEIGNSDGDDDNDFVDNGNIFENLFDEF